MLVKVYQNVNDIVEFETSSTFLKEILNEAKQKFGDELTTVILTDSYFYFGKDDEEVFPLTEEVLLSDLTELDELMLVRDVEGNDPISATMIMAASISATSALGIGAAGGTILMSAGVASAIAGVLNAAIMMGLSLAMNSLMSPDTSFKGDPSKKQGKQSNLFNTAPLIREQGGSVPIVYGNPYCGGVLIASAISSEDVRV